MLDEAKPGDKIVIQISSPGGYVTGLYQYMWAIKNTKAQTTTVCVVRCYSAGAFLFMLSPNKRYADSATLLFHIANDGKAPLPLTDPIQLEFLKFFDRHISPYFARKELVSLLCGKDLIISRDYMPKFLSRIPQSKYTLLGLLNTEDGKKCTKRLARPLDNL